MRISGPVAVELPPAGSVTDILPYPTDTQFEELLKLFDDEFFGYREVTIREFDKMAEAMLGTPGGCAEAGLGLSTRTC